MYMNTRGDEIVTYFKDRIRKFSCLKTASVSTRFSFGIDMRTLLSLVRAQAPDLYPCLSSVADITNSQMALLVD
jgi:hypothetical protein